MSAQSPPTIDGLRLYRVEITQEIWVLAPNAATAELDAPGHVRDDMGEPDCYAVEVKKGTGSTRTCWTRCRTGTMTCGCVRSSIKRTNS